MQVKHEAQLLEALTIKSQDFVSSSQSTLDSYTINQNSLPAIDHLAACPIFNLVAVYQSNTNHILLIDSQTYQKRERFPLKSCDKKFSKRSFRVKGLEFSPDGSRLAVGQTDCIIYIYKLFDLQQSGPGDKAITGAVAANTTIKPTITGKFVCSSPVTCLIWVDCGIIFGTQDGKVKLIFITSRSSISDKNALTAATSSKVINIFKSIKGSLPLSLAYKAPVLIISFADATTQLVTLFNDIINEDSVVGLVDSASRRNSSLPAYNSNTFTPHINSTIKHSCPIQNLRIVQSNVICCTGFDGRISFHSIEQPENYSKLDGTLNVNWLQNIDIKEDIMASDFSVINEILAVVTKTRLLFLKNEPNLNCWQLQSSFIKLSDGPSITSIKWLKDGTQLVIGTLNGSVELFSCSWSKQASIGEQLDICHIAKNRVRITDRARNLLATYKTQYDIKRVNLLDNGQSVIIWTTNSLLLACLGQPNQSEINWNREKSAKFFFEKSGFVLIYNSSSYELIVVKLGQDSIKYSAKLDFISKNIISVRQYPSSINQLQLINDASVDNKLSPTNYRQRSAGSPKQSRHSSLIAETQVDQVTPTLDQPNNRNPIDSINERLAFVTEFHTIIVINLKNNAKEMIQKHEERVDWLELSSTSNHLVYRYSTSRKLYLTFLNKNLKEANNNQLLVDDCEFAKWFPQTDILIAQSKHKVTIWYDINNEIQNTVIFDTRSYNPTRTLPLVNLSLLNNKNDTRKAYPTVVKLQDDEESPNLILSNGQTISLDKLKVKFYKELNACRLKSAVEFLTKFGATNSKLWSKLGWIAIAQSNCDVALKAFNHLGHKSMVQYLEKCVETPEECEWRLALLLGNWDLFEQLAGMDQIVSTYKRLNKWSKLIEYLNRMQQFRQKDLAEEEFRHWLIGKERFREAANNLAKQGDLVEALELLLKYNCFKDAADLVTEKENISLVNKQRALNQSTSRLTELVENLKSKLIEKNLLLEAAKICDKVLNEYEQAIDLYIKAGSFEEAYELAQLVLTDQIHVIEELYAKNLIKQYKDNKVRRKKALKAIELLTNAKLYFEALETSIKLKDYERSYNILQTMKISDLSEEQLKEVKVFSKEVANSMLECGKNKEAIESHLISENYEQVVEMCIEIGDYSKAFEISSNFIHANDKNLTVKRFNELAEDFKMKNKIERAEKIYLMLNNPNAAIELNRGMKNYDRMLELVEEYEPDSLEDNLLLLARQLESEGNFKAAETYLLRASDLEWTNVVRMYRLANKWEDAHRVAKEHCSSDQDPLLVQLSYWWCKSLNNEREASELLHKLNAFQPVIDFCIENKNYQLAIELCDQDETSGNLKQELIKKYALFLEEMHKFNQAEEMLMKYGRIEEAVNMYVDNDLHQDAIRLVEERLNKEESLNDVERKKLVDLLNRTLINSAKRLSEEVKPQARNQQQFSYNGLASKPNERLMSAQQLYLRAQRPDLAVEMYKERSMWQEAIQVAQRFAPQLLEGVESALDSQVLSDIEPILASQQQLSRSSSSRSSLMSSSHSNEPSSSGGHFSEERSALSSSSMRRENALMSSSGDYLKNQAEWSMKNGDIKGAKIALGKFMDTLADGVSYENEPILANINQCLSQLEKVLLDSTYMNNNINQWTLAISSLTRKIASNCPWGNLSSARQEFEVWIKLRDMLANCLLNLLTDKSIPGQQLESVADHVERHLLAAHYICLHECLTNQLQFNLQHQMPPNKHPRAKQKQPNFADNKQAILLAGQAERLRDQCGQVRGCKEVLSLVGKLSLSLLRYTDLIGPRQAFHTAGFWLLAANRKDLACFAWTKLIEIYDDAASPSLERDLQRLGIPTSFLAAPAANESNQNSMNASEKQQLAEVRRWLLETLIDGGGQVLPLDERGQLECSLAGWPRPHAPCLICGYPVFAGSDQLILNPGPSSSPRGGRFYQVRQSEWRALVAIKRRSEPQRMIIGSSMAQQRQIQPVTKSGAQAASVGTLKEMIEFIIKLSGAQSESLPL